MSVTLGSIALQIRTCVGYCGSIVTCALLFASVSIAQVECVSQFGSHPTAVGGILDFETVTQGNDTVVAVSVMARGARDAPKVVARLYPPSGNPIELKKGASRYFEATVPRGRYRLEVTAESSSQIPLSAPKRWIRVTGDRIEVPTYVAPSDVPYMRMGKGILPFTPQSDLIAVVFPFKVPDPGDAHVIAAKAKAQNLPVTPAHSGLPKSLGFVNLEGAVWLFRLQDQSKREQTINKLHALLGRSARIGVPVDLGSRLIRVLDNHFVVQFKLPTAENSWLQAVRAERVRKVGRDKNGDLILIRFRSHDYCMNLAALEGGLLKDVLITAEPDLILQFVDHQTPPSNWPNEERYSKYQHNMERVTGNHLLQGIRQAWGITQTLPPGRANVFIGSLDQGIDLNHKEVACRASDNSVQVAACHDYQAAIDCSNRDYVPPSGPANSHGMAVFGVISACTDNGQQREIAGIAPGVHHIAVRMGNPMGITAYTDALLWMAGLSVQCPTGDATCVPRSQISKAAQVINCSHGIDQIEEAVIKQDQSTGKWEVSWLDLYPVSAPTLMEATFQTLVLQGRSGAGTVLVYSAGNNSTAVEDREPLASSNFTLAIANCWVNPETGQQQRFPGSENGLEGSNYSADTNGGVLDICALGESSETISTNCLRSRQWESCTFGGTSAAAANVSGVIGLMLSVNDKLTFDDVRKILRDSAEVIDADGNWIGGRHKFYGSGRLNACRAVKMAKEHWIGEPIIPDPCP